MAKIDDLIIQIKADTQQLQKDLKQIQGKIKVTGAVGGAAFGTMGASLTKIKGPALAAAAGIAAIVIPMKVIAGIGAQFEDLKDSLDQVFGSMEAGDAAMQKVFQFAQTTPFQIEDATKAFIQLKSAGIEPSMDMLQTFADTASTSIDQLGAFEALIRIVQRSAAGGMGLEEINQLDDRGIPATKILTQELGKSRDELSEFGKTAEGAAEMVQILIKGLESRFGGAMANKMDNLSTKTSNMVIAFKQLGDEIFKSGLGDFLKNMADSLTNMANAIAKSVRAMNNNRTLEDVGVDTSKSPKEQLEETTRLRKAALLEVERTNKLRANPNDQTGMSQISVDNQRRRAGEIYVQLVEHELQLRKEVLSLSKEIKKTEEDKTKPTQDNINFLTEFKKLLEDSVPEIDKINAKLSEVEALRGKIGEDGKLLATPEEIDAVVDVLNKMKDELVDVATFGSAMQQTIINASNAFTTDFVNSLMAGENALESFKNFAKNIVSQIISTFLQMAVVNNILNSVFGLKGADALPTFSFGAKKSAGGGSAYGGQPMLVGERGPEIFVPHSNGNIMNNMNSKNAMGGGGTTVINQSINFATGVVPTVRAEVMKMMPQIADVTKGAVAEAAIRGGSYRRMLQGG